jgi:hypothetical protein
MDEVFHKYATYVDDYRDGTTSGSSWDPSNPNKKVSIAEGMNSVIGSWYYCEEGSGYSSRCNPYGLTGYNVSEISWLYNDYQRNYGSATNEPAAEFTDMFDGYDISYDTYSYEGGYWTQDIASSDAGYGYGILFFVDGPRWSYVGASKHLYRPVIEVKKSKFGNVVREDDIEIAIDGNIKFKDGLKNATYTISDEDIATVNNKGEITGKKIGITYVTAVKDDKTYYAKVVVNHKAVEYTKHFQTVLFNPVTGEECTTSEYKCSNNVNCKKFLVVGETANGNYILVTNHNYPYTEDTYQKSWSAKWAIDEDPTGAVEKYGDMAYNHWYRVMEYLAKLTKDWKTEPLSDYIDFTTKEYVIPWSKPAYYENGNPVYTKARIFSLEDIDGMVRNYTTTEYGYPWTNTYELLHNTGNTTIIMRGYPGAGSSVIGQPVVGYLTNYWHSNSTYDSNTHSYVSYHYPNNTLSYIAIEVKKDKIHTIADGYDGIITFTSTNESDYVSTAYNWVQTSEDGGEIEIVYANNYNSKVLPKTNGHVKLVGTNVNNPSNVQTKEYFVDIKYSCGQVDICGNVTPACN